MKDNRKTYSNNNFKKARVNRLISSKVGIRLKKYRNREGNYKMIEGLFINNT